MLEDKGIAVVAVGGNSLILNPQNPNMDDQWVAVRETCRHIADMVEMGYRVVVTHGNGPQVGFILTRMEIAAEKKVHIMGLDIIGADTQGSIGYMLCSSLNNEFTKRNIEVPVAAVVTQVLVDAQDPAFEKPSKPIGGYLSEEMAQMYRDQGWPVTDDAGRGLRRRIASPMPLEIMELPSIKMLIEAGSVVVAVGGGGIPVVRENGILTGARAVIDKDHASSLLATGLKANLLLISTAVEQVHINHGKPEARALWEINWKTAQTYLDQGHFPPGSMGPKIQAIIRFLESGGKAGLITSPQCIRAALEHKTGTWIYP